MLAPPDGGGKAVDGSRWPAHLFPELFLRRQCTKPEHAALINDFLAWQAPWLLQLPGIEADSRKRLEQAAWRRPRETSRVFRLFPLIVDRQGLTAARVSAKLIGQSGNADELAEAFYPSLSD